jgi:hypothetical protein
VITEFHPVAVLLQVKTRPVQTSHYLRNAPRSSSLPLSEINFLHVDYRETVFRYWEFGVYIGSFICRLLFGEGIGMMYRNNVRVLLTPATTL